MTGNDSTGEVLARFSHRLRLADIPDETQRLVKLILLDSLGCLMVGRQTDDAAMVAATAAEALGTPDQAASSPAQRAMVMGYGISASGSMDSYVPAKLHTTPSVVGAGLALASHRGMSGAQLVTAVAAGLESAVRIADAFNPPELRARGWHSPGVVGPLSAALTCAKVLELDVRQTRDALGLAGSQSSGTFAAWGTPTVKFHQARGAMAGLLAAFLARRGFSSSPDVFEAADGGLLNVYSDGGRPELVAAGLGTEWRVHDLSLRRWPTPHVNVISAVLDLRNRHADAVRESEHVAVEISKEDAAFQVFDSPSSRFEAMNSIPLTAATALLNGTLEQEHLHPEWFMGEQARGCIKERIQVSVSRELPSGCIRAFPVPLRDSTHVVEAHVPLGSRGHPIGRSSLVDKFVRNVSGRWPEEPARQLAEQVLTIEQVDDTRKVLEPTLSAV